MAERRPYDEALGRRQVFVGQVAPSTDPVELAAHFRESLPSTVGAFVSADGGRGTLSYGLVEFVDEESVDRAVAMFDKSVFAGNAIKVRGRSASRQDSSGASWAGGSAGGFAPNLGDAVEVEEGGSAGTPPGGASNGAGLMDRIAWDDDGGAPSPGGGSGGGGGGGARAREAAPHPVRGKKDRESSVYVTKIPVAAHDRDLTELFRTVDGGADVNFFREPNNSYAFVQMSSVELAREAVERLDCTVMRGSTISVTHRDAKYARAPLTEEEREEKELRTVWVGRFGDGVNASHLEDIFRAVDGGAAVDFLQRSSGRFRYAFVTLSSRERAVAAMRSLNGTEVGEGSHVAVTLRRPLSAEEKRQGGDMGGRAGGGGGHRVVEVRGFPGSMTADAVRALVAGGGGGEGAAVVHFEGGEGGKEPLAVVRLASAEAARSAAGELHGTEVQGFRVRQRTVFVGNLPYQATHADVVRHFSAAGPVMIVDMPSEAVPASDGVAAQTRNKGYCFVRFETREAAEEAIRTMDGGELHGQAVEVAPKVKRPPSPTVRYLRRQPQGLDEAGEGGAVGGSGEDGGGSPSALMREVYVCGLPLDARREDLEALFGEAGAVASVRGPMAGPRVMTKGAARFETGYGFVQFREAAGAEAAVELLSGKIVGGSTITVKARWPADGGQAGDARGAAAAEWGGASWGEPVGHRGDDEGLYGGRFGGGFDGGAGAPGGAGSGAGAGGAGGAVGGGEGDSPGGGGEGDSLMSAMGGIEWDASPLENPVVGDACGGEGGVEGDDQVGGGEPPPSPPPPPQQQAFSRDDQVLYLNGLSWTCDDGSLKEFCREHAGGVVKAKVVSDRVTTASGERQVNKSRGYGFVWFKTPELAAAAMPLLDGAMMDGRVIQARPRARQPASGTGGDAAGGGGGGEERPERRAQAPSESTQEEKERQVFVGNVAFQASKEDVRAHFEESGFLVKRVTMPVDTVRTEEGQLEDKSRGFCFVTLKDSGAAREAVEAMEGSELMGRRVFVTRRARSGEDQADGGGPGGGGGGGGGPGEAPRVLQKRSLDVDMRTVYCSRFLLDTTQEEITRIFTEAGGRVTNVYMPTVMTMTKDGPTRMSKGFAFVTYPSEEGVAAALALDGESFNGCRLVVRRKILDPEQGGGAGGGGEGGGGGRAAMERPGGSETNLLDGLDLEALRRQHLEEQGAREEEEGGGLEAREEGGVEGGEAEGGEGGDEGVEGVGGGRGGPAARDEASVGGGGEPAADAAPGGPAGGDAAAEGGGAARKAKEAVPQPKRSGRQAKQRKQADAKKVLLAEGATIKQLADDMGVRLVDVIKHLIRLGEEPQTVADTVSVDAQEYLVTECGMVPVLPEGAESTRLGRSFSDEEYALLPEKSPIVTIMGHVDHGKTTLLDHLRNASVAAGEAGGITQSISAFEVDRPGLGRICFVDTPGHQAFSAMRERGTRATDIVILVVSATDGVQPQTVEVIQHARAAQVPLIVAVNKCDLPDADAGVVIAELASEGVVVEGLGGDVQSVEVSGLTGMNMDKLEEAVLLLAGMMELRAPKDGPGEGFVVEARKDKSLGPVASVIVTLGQLRVGDHIVVGGEWGRVRVLRDCNRQPAEVIGPSCVCEVTGFRGQPTAGEELYVVESEKAAVEHAERLAARRAKAAALSAKQQQQQQGQSPQHDSSAGGGPDEEGADAVVEVRELPVIVKTDVAGSLEALVGALSSLPSHEVRLKIVHAEIGPVTQHDVDVAEAAGAGIVTFNLHEPTAAVAKSARQRKVRISASRVIYTLLEEVEKDLIELLPAEVTTSTVGEAEVLQVFEIKGKAGAGNTLVAGCKVTKGTMQPSTSLQVVRKGEVVHEGQLQSLRHHKDVVKEVKEGQECGVVVEGFEGYEEGDEIRCISRVETRRTKL